MRGNKQVPQVTYWCGAYSFPHRLSGGRCSGSAWANEYFIYYGNECATCNCNTASRCDVANGIEDIMYCEAMQEQLRTQEGLRLPMDEEDREKHYLDRCSRRIHS